jgi:hypothetical protein
VSILLEKEAFDGSRNEVISEAIKKFDAILERFDFYSEISVVRSRLFFYVSRSENLTKFIKLFFRNYFKIPPHFSSIHLPKSSLPKTLPVHSKRTLKFNLKIATKSTLFDGSSNIFAAN